jgi:hypothetical protein
VQDSAGSIVLQLKLCGVRCSWTSAEISGWYSIRLVAMGSRQNARHGVQYNLHPACRLGCQLL